MSDDVELLGITIDKALNFKRYFENLCCTAQTSFMLYDKSEST